MRCSVLQCVAVKFVSCKQHYVHTAHTDNKIDVLQCVVVCCGVWQRVAVCCMVLQCVAVCCSVLQCVAVRCSVLQCVAL